MWKRAHKVRFEGSARVWVIGALALFEAALVGVLWNRSRAPAEMAYLMKVGPRYVLAWRDTDARYDSAVYSDLDEAVRFADEELGLRRGLNPNDTGEIEYLNFDDRPVGYVVQWKIVRQPFLNQLTFNSRSEARYFWSSIRLGSYSPSPFGHSLLFLPKPN
jgi:hypothetical protein